jgi:glycosyltransferase involved in cell wall biosynthesis
MEAKLDTEAPGLAASENGEGALNHGHYEDGPDGPTQQWNGAAKRVGQWYAPAPYLNGHGPDADEQPVLAVFCFEEPDSVVGRYVNQLAEALARRGVPLHLFSRRAFPVCAPGVYAHGLGACPGDDPLGQVQEFTRRACNAFTRQFPTGAGRVTLLGCEWSAVPAVSLLHSTRNMNALLSLHSLERQRGDLGGELSRRIDEIERSGLHECKAVVLHDDATAAAVKELMPECEGRIVSPPWIFPVHDFEGVSDPGTVKSRFHIGPVDPVVLYLGDMDERHGPDLLMKSVPAVLKKYPQARFVFAGDGDLWWPLRVHARYLLLDHAVRMAGHVDGQALRELFQAADIVAVPSREPTESWPLLAAWASRRPVIATHATAGALLEHERDGLLIDAHDGGCLWGIDRLLADPELIKSVGAGGRRKLEERHGWAAAALQIEELMGVQKAE